MNASPSISDLRARISSGHGQAFMDAVDAYVGQHVMNGGRLNGMSAALRWLLDHPRLPRSTFEILWNAAGQNSQLRRSILESTYQVPVAFVRDKILFTALPNDLLGAAANLRLVRDPQIVRVLAHADNLTVRASLVRSITATGIARGMELRSFVREHDADEAGQELILDVLDATKDEHLTLLRPQDLARLLQAEHEDIRRRGMLAIGRLNTQH